MTGGVLPLADAAATHRLGVSLAALLGHGDVVALSGPLGGGKTSLARGVLAGLGLAEEAPSPSFALVIDYQPPELRLAVGHVDLYRLNDPEEVEELGLDDLLHAGALLVEWPERAGVDRWPWALRLRIDPDGTGGRRLTWAAPTAWDARWPPPLP